MMPARLVVALLTFLIAAAAPAEECVRGIVAELKLAPVESGSPVVTVAVNGAARRFLVEPGALWTAMSTSAAARLGLKALPLGSAGRSEIIGGGEETSQFAEPDRLEFGGVAAAHPKVLLLPETVIGPDLDGVLGSDLLGRFDLEFDFAERVLRLVAPAHCPGPVVKWTREFVSVPFEISTSRHLVVPMALDGKRVSVAIDTARIKTAMSESSAARLFGLTAASAGVDVPADAEAAKTLKFRTQFDALSIEGLRLRYPTVYVWADEAEAGPSRRGAGAGEAVPATSIQLERQDLAIGTDVLRHLHVYIAFADRMLYLSAADAHN